MSVMTYVDRYFDQLVEPMFQRDEQGRELFFPFGLGSRGRIVPDAAAGDRIRSRMKHFWIAFFLGWIPLVAIASTFIVNIWAMLGLLGLSVAGMWAFASSLAQGFDISGRRMTPSNQFASVLQNASMKRLVSMTALSIVLTGVSAANLLVPSISQGQPAWFKPLTGMTMIFFAATTIMWAVLTIKKWRSD